MVVLLGFMYSQFKGLDHLGVHSGRLPQNGKAHRFTTYVSVFSFFLFGALYEQPPPRGVPCE